MEDKLLRYTLRMDRRLFAKFRYVAEYEGRSANREIEQMIRKRVEKFEKINGEIPLSEKDKYDLE
ncbi:MAG: Arc family DNA-binding protein [Ruminococcaceae bacterium]|nr:Arc family DNA-binding protein [Oscillospiraceae bacterium]